MKKIGFIGSGKMASAIIKGIIKNKFIKPENITATQAEKEGIAEKSKELGVSIILDNKKLTHDSDIIFIATKPNQVTDVLQEIKPFITTDKLIVSIAAGITTEKLENSLPEKTRVIRIMPKITTESTGIVIQNIYAILGHTTLAKIAAPNTTNGERKNNLNVRLTPVWI